MNMSTLQKCIVANAEYITHRLIN